MEPAARRRPPRNTSDSGPLSLRPTPNKTTTRRKGPTRLSEPRCGQPPAHKPLPPAAPSPHTDHPGQAKGPPPSWVTALGPWCGPGYEAGVNSTTVPPQPAEISHIHDSEVYPTNRPRPAPTHKPPLSLTLLSRNREIAADSRPTTAGTAQLGKATETVLSHQPLPQTPIPAPGTLSTAAHLTPPGRSVRSCRDGALRPRPRVRRRGVGQWTAARRRCGRHRVVGHLPGEGVARCWRPGRPATGWGAEVRHRGAAAPTARCSVRPSRRAGRACSTREVPPWRTAGCAARGRCRSGWRWAAPGAAGWCSPSGWR